MEQSLALTPGGQYIQIYPLWEVRYLLMIPLSNLEFLIPSDVQVSSSAEVHICLCLGEKHAFRTATFEPLLHYILVLRNLDFFATVMMYFDRMLSFFLM